MEYGEGDHQLDTMMGAGTINPYSKVGWTVCLDF
jgi:hypothetical protein